MGFFDVCGEHFVKQVVFGQGVGVFLSGAQFRAGWLDDGVDGDGWQLAVFFGVAVAPAGEFPYAGLEQVLDGGVSADGVAVDGGVAACQLHG